ncbi:MAG: HAMP domain-containing protein [Deinococcus sp.]|nr:HAMP domain-containing protein [Deinococcus sp.]
MRLVNWVKQLDEQTPFRIKLLGILVGVIVVGVTVVYLLASRAVDASFQDLSVELGTAHAQTVQDTFADYYLQHGGWAGVEELLANPMITMGGHHELVLADPTGRVLAAPDAHWTGRVLSSTELDTGVTVTVSGQLVGVLVAGTALNLFGSSEREFLASVTRAIVGAGLAAALVAVLLGVLFLRQLIRPLRQLATATERVAAGELRQRVAVAAKDELGRLAQAFNRMSERLAHSETLRRNMIADIAHELRNPLSVIKADLQALVDGVYPLTKERIASVQEEGVLLERLVDDLRTLSLADAGELMLKRQPIELVGLVQRIAANSRPALEAKGIQLELKLPEEPLELWIDPDRIGQVLYNLLGNAGQHTPQGGRITMVVEPIGAHVQVTVSDTGPGIAAEELPHLFERFWRGKRSKESGTGLGLAIAKRLVEAHGGRLWAESPGMAGASKGATFTLTLPSEGHSVQVGNIRKGVKA